MSFITRITIYLLGLSLWTWFIFLKDMKTLNQIYEFLVQKEFLTAFWSSILSAVIVTVTVSIFVNYFTPLFKYPELSLVVKQGTFYSKKIKVTQRPDGDYEASFILAIKNSGRKTFQQGEGYWHVYFPNAEKTVPSSSAAGFVSVGESSHVRDLINLPVYPKSFTDIGPSYNLILRKEAAGNASVRYFFETNYGYFPKTVKLDQSTGAVLFSNMGTIEIDWPK